MALHLPTALRAGRLFDIDPFVFIEAPLRLIVRDHPQSALIAAGANEENVPSIRREWYTYGPVTLEGFEGQFFVFADADDPTVNITMDERGFDNLSIERDLAFFETGFPVSPGYQRNVWVEADAAFTAAYED